MDSFVMNLAFIQNNLCYKCTWHKVPNFIYDKWQTDKQESEADGKKIKKMTISAILESVRVLSGYDSFVVRVHLSNWPLTYLNYGLES